MTAPHDQALAVVTDGGALALPAALSDAALALLFSWYRVPGVKTSRDSARLAELGVRLAPGQWAILLPGGSRRVLERILPKAELAQIHVAWNQVVLVQPAGAIHLNKAATRRLRQALDVVRPKQANGLPFPWSPPETPTEPLGRAPDEDDVLIDGAPDPAPGPVFDGPTELDADTIRADFERLRAHLGLPDFPLVIRRGAIHKQGFVAGRVHLDRERRPVKMVVTTCPNSDRAEAAATLAHEFAHVACGVSGHGDAFKRALVDLASEVWGPAAFGPARRALDQAVTTVDAWVACGIRAHLTGAPAPAEVHPEEAQVAVVVRRIQRLRALAADQLGRPEGCSAAAKANDLVVTHGLGAYRVALPADVGDALCDQWILIGKRNPWKATVAFAVAEFCDVFALESTGYGGMHLFGRHADLVTAEYLITVATERIASRCQQHLKRWRARHPGYPRGFALSERTSFLHSAASGLKATLQAAKGQSDREAPGPRAEGAALRAAEAFAFAEHDKRGSRWGGGGVLRHAHNDAGYEAGRSLTLSKGVEGRARPAGLIE